MDQIPLTLLIETETGGTVRVIPAASPLPDGTSSGAAAEVATHGRGCRLGIPDFLFRAEVVAVGLGME